MQQSTPNKNSSNLHIIPQTQYYKNSQIPLLSEQKTNSIQQKLMLQKDALHYTRQRQSNLDYFVKYNFNPFLLYKGKEAQMINAGKPDDLGNIVNKLAQMSVPHDKLKAKINKIQSQPGNLKDIKKQFQLFSNKLLNNIQKQYAENNNQQTISKSPLKTLLTKPSPQSIQQRRRPHQFTEFHLTQQNIQIIVAVKQQNFFLKNMKKVNIFKIARGEDQDLSTRQKLKKYHFCNNSVVERLGKLKFPIYRDLSTLGRKIIMGQSTQGQNIIDFVDSYELSFKMKQLLYHDIMSIASNRFSADFLYKLMNFDEGAIKQVSDTASQQKQEPEVIYKKYQLNLQDNFINQNQQMQQIVDYKLLKSNDVQKINQIKYNLQKDHLQNKLQLRKNLNKNTVKDQKLHQKVQLQIKYTLENLLHLDKQKMQSDRLIRYNKLMKNKSEVLKIKTIMQALANKNKQDQLLNLQNNPTRKSPNKSKNKSQNKTPRKSITPVKTKSITPVKTKSKI